jgi:Mn-dependent DtxR family transcriptional regulator
MAKEMGKSISTISAYTSKLKKLGYIRFIEGGKIKRNLKGMKINFEDLSLRDI